MPLKLEDLGYRVGDFVTFNSDKESTGGIVFVIAKNYDSPVPDAERGRWGNKHVNEKGKQLKPMEVMGYIRLKPIFEFFPTQLGSNPKGAAGTVLVYHTDLNSFWGKDRMQRVDLVTIAAKYAELGNLIRDLARIHGMEVGRSSETADAAHDSPQE